jgi:RNA polymerase sigma-70 factor (ECF subfamily)
MDPSARTTTTTQLLEALHDPSDEAVWRDFDARYRPIIYAIAQRLGLRPDDAAEIAQETLTEFVRDYRNGGYERGRGRLRSWIIGIARHRVTDALRQRAKRREMRGESAFEELPDDNRLVELWEAERERTILDLALKELRENTKTDEKTVRSFEMVAIEGVPAEAVAAETGMTVAEVYRVKNRITRRLREIVERLTQAYLEGE